MPEAGFGRLAPAWLLVCLCLPASVRGQTLPLSEALDSALRAHPAVASAHARRDASLHATAVARAARLPGLSLEGSLTRFEEPMIVAPLHSFDPSRPPVFDETLVQGRLSARYTLFDGGERSARIRASEALAAAAGAAAASSEMDVLEQVVRGYSAVLAARTVREAALAQVEALRVEAERVQDNLAVGSAARVEVLRARAALHEAVAAAASAEARVGLAERSLARTSGLSTERVADRDLQQLEIRSGAEPEPAGAHPSVERARGTVTAATARLEENEAGWLPRVDLSAGVVDFGTATGGHRAEWQSGLQLSWPVFTGGGRRARVRAAEAELRAERGALAVTELAVAEELDRARTAALDADARVDALRTAVVQWDEVARIERLALSSGSGVQADLLRAEAGLFRAQAALAQARHDAVVARVAVAKARGALDTTWIERTLEVR